MASPIQSVDSEPLADRKLLPTTSKGGAGIPDVSVEDMLGDFRSFIRRQFGLSEVATKIESKYDIPKGQWSLDNIKKAWGKTTRLNGGRRMKWSFAVMAQLQKHQETIAKIKFDHEYWSTKDQLMAVVEELRDAKSKLEHYDEIRTDLQNKTSELQQLSVQIGEFQNQVFKVESKYQQLQLNTERSDDEYRSTKRQLITVVEELQDAKSKLETDLQDAKSKLEHSDEIKTDLQVAKSKLETELQVAKSKLEHYDEIKTDLQDAKSKLETELQVAKSKLEHYDEIKTELRDAKSKLETDLQNKTSELQQLSFQITEFQNQVFEVESKYRQLQLKTEQIELENCKLVKERCVLERNITSVTEHCNSLTNMLSVQKIEQTQKAVQATHLVAQSAIAQPRSIVKNKSFSLSDESDEDSVPTIQNTKAIRLAPLKRKRVRVGSKKIEEDGKTITRNIFDHQWVHEQIDPSKIDEWSKGLPHPKKGGKITWDGIHRLQAIYSLHPFDGVQILTIMLGTRISSTLRNEVEVALGDDLQNLEAGWLTIKNWLLQFRPPRTNWSKITACFQKKNEDIQDFEERFLRTWMEYSGMTLDQENDTWDASTLSPLKTAFIAGVKPGVSAALNLVLPAWATAGTYRDIVDRCIQIDRGLHNQATFNTAAAQMQPIAQIQPMLPAAPAAAVAAPAGISAVTTISPPAPEQTSTLAPLKSRKKIPQCLSCGRVGHWMAKCYQKQRMDSRDDNEVDNVHYNTSPPRGQPCNTYQQDTPSMASGQPYWLSNYNHGLLLQLINNSIIIAQLFTTWLYRIISGNCLFGLPPLSNMKMMF
ncbi:uncharacterized protein [Scyliorhinus torazame]|uniref:uncharacterized protein n=1 Tax=Scyliorhinus torazame TaxID=75743 RepID=UPI003B5A2238